MIKRNASVEIDQGVRAGLTWRVQPVACVALSVRAECLTRHQSIRTTSARHKCAYRVAAAVIRSGAGHKRARRAARAEAKIIKQDEGR